MSEEGEIPCATCQSWAKKQKKFTCNPDECKGLNAWLYNKAPQLNKEHQKIRVQLPKSANQYVV